MPLAIAKLLSGMQDISSLIAKPATRPGQENLRCEAFYRAYDLHLATRSPTPLPSNPLIGWILFWNSSLKLSTDSLTFPIDRLRV